jgi:hypothetical protein
MRRKDDLFSMYPLFQEKSAQRRMFERLQVDTKASGYAAIT